MNELTILENQIGMLMSQISEAALRQDLATIQRLVRKATEVQELRDQVTTIQQRIENLAREDTSATLLTTKKHLNGKLRELPIEVTQGMIRQNLLTLTPHLKRGNIKIGDELEIEALPSGEKFRTVLLEKGNKLQARGEIARFYRDAKVQEDDFVLLTEISPEHWTLKKASPGQYGVSRMQLEYV